MAPTTPVRSVAGILLGKSGMSVAKRKKKMKKKFTVFIDQRNRINYQILAEDEQRAGEKGKRLYIKHFDTPPVSVEEGWIVESDGEDK